MNLYEITNDLMEFQEMCSDIDADMNDEVVKDTLEGLQGAYDDKVESWLRVIKNLKAEMVAVEKEAERMDKRAKTIENNIDRMKKTLITSMIKAGRDKAGNTLKAKVVSNGGVLPLIVDDVELPEEYQKIEVKPNNDAIRNALESGKKLPFARYGERSVHLNIK